MIFRMDYFTVILHCRNGEILSGKPAIGKNRRFPVLLKTFGEIDFQICACK